MQDFSITVCLGSLLYSLDSEGCVRCLGGADSGNAMFWTGVVVFARTLYVCLVNQHAATLLVVGIGLIGKPDFDTLAACKGSDGFFLSKLPLPHPSKTDSLGYSCQRHRARRKQRNGRSIQRPTSSASIE